eukprot:Hpha_TRINITY_DN15805_c0_g1::TRINITY_DN15805_c0_g1_i1::g.190154::m.190154
MASDFGSVKGATCWVLGSDSVVGAALVPVLKEKGAGKIVEVPTKDAKGLAAKAGTHPPADFIFNGVGGSALRAATDSAAEGATVVTFANASSERMDLAGTRAVLSGTSFVSFWYPRWQSQTPTEERIATYREVAAFAAKSKPSLPVQNFTFDQFPQAFDAAVGGASATVKF